jgi:hypothetical protein
MKETIYFLLAALMAVMPVAAQQATVEKNTTELTKDSTEKDSTVHVEFLGIPLSATPQEMLDEMDSRGMDFIGLDSASHVYMLSGTLSGMKVDIDMWCNKDLTKINYIKISTPIPKQLAAGSHHHGHHSDYDKLMKWLCNEYDEPDWDGNVRSYRFCRWFSDFDHDIVLIATGRGNAEAWFYENHVKRHHDYYAILKYCEKNPAPDVPMMTAEESISWKRNDSVVVKKKHVVKKRYKRKYFKKRKTIRRKPARKKTTRKTAKRRGTAKKKRR